MTASGRTGYVQVGLQGIPKILGQLDRNRLSPTYGCFDRAFWHYKTASFPSGMAQEFVLPLALVYRHAMPGGEAYFQQVRLKEWVMAAIHYASISAHRDGSCDDYFPYERALGAVAFSLYACTESALLLALPQPAFDTFFRKRAHWLLAHDETGILSNHHALTVLALYNVYLLTDETIFLQGAQRALARLLSWQSVEGWFPEYAGCDPGYHTATIDFLAKYYRKSGDAQVLAPLRAAVRFAADFMHPDGSFGGDYGSRNTALFWPHGFELLGRDIAEATDIADRYLYGVAQGKRVFLEDDRLIGHLTYNHLQAYMDYCPQRQSLCPQGNRIHFWPEAGLYVRWQEPYYAVVSIAKGGVIRVFDRDRLIYADNGLIIRRRDGRCLVTHVLDRYEYDVQDRAIRIQGRFGYVTLQTFTPWSMLLFYLMMLVFGRFCRNLIRSGLQKLLIVGKRRAALVFQRTIHFQPQLMIVDEIWDQRPRRTGKQRLTALYAGSDHTSIYVAMSNAYQASCLYPWTDDTAALAELQKTGYVKITRPLPTGNAQSLETSQ